MSAGAAEMFRSLRPDMRKRLFDLQSSMIRHGLITDAASLAAFYAGVGARLKGDTADMADEPIIVERK